MPKDQRSVDFSPYGPKKLEREEMNRLREIREAKKARKDEEDPSVYREVLANLGRYILQCEEGLILSALQWKLDKQGENHFDDLINRIPMLEILADTSRFTPPQMQVFDAINRWYELNPTRFDRCFLP
ncbi:hypothetical protein PFISCL1PPCAC_27034 [Pristionchus fissidentatus]|uniref:Uncharacterized protein n=1 Tax=Pristionchus fissidentatus TaxID=1538716 RepID=A0AAV5WUP0_9BILA|nr:hypothetical protein PFISCL1PPCAC_27034 [Pristionchus fissidentatus]